MSDIYPGLIHQDFLITEDGQAWRLWLWGEQKDLKTWAERYGNEAPGTFDESIGLHSPNKHGVKTDVDIPQLLGDIHFVRGEWSLEIVAHELLHALFWYINLFVSDFARALYKCWMDEEEELCYPFGHWVHFVHSWLWKHDPNPLWVRKEKEGE